MLNQNPNTFTFNGHSSDEFGIRIERKPDLNRSGRKFKSATVTGRNGNIYQLQDAWDEVTVTYHIYAGGREKGDVLPAFTDIMEWLNSADDYAVLTDTYDPEHYRLAVFVDSTDIESQWYTIGEATIKFRCQPQRYLVQNPISVQDGDTITNTTKHTALPIITLTGSEIITNLINLERTLPTINRDGYKWESTNLTDISFMLYRYASLGAEYRWTILRYTQATASSKGGTLTAHVNSTGTLTFTPFQDGFGDVGVGVGLNVTPDSDYTISCETTSGDSKVSVIFFDSSGSKSSIGIAEESRSGAGTLTLTFHVPVNCENILVIFCRTDYTAGTFSSIMLNTGTTAVPFFEYSDGATETFTINDTTLSFHTAGFDTAVIDCEKENFTIDGVNANMTSTVYDQYGNLATNYLRLVEGNNTVTFSNDITAVSIVPHFWDL